MRVKLIKACQVQGQVRSKGPVPVTGPSALGSERGGGPGQGRLTISPVPGEPSRPGSLALE